MKRSAVLGLILTVVMVGVAVADVSSLPGSAWYTGHTIQNVDSYAAQTVQVTAYDETQDYLLVLASSTDPLASGASATFFSSDDRFDPDLPDGFQGAAMVAADAAIKAIVNVTNVENVWEELGVAGGWAAGQYQGIDGNAVDTTVVFPLVKNDFGGKTTTFFIQNAGTGPTHIVATYQMRTSPTDTNVVEYTQELDITGTGRMVVLNPAAATSAGGTAMPTGRLGALTVTSWDADDDALPGEDIAGVVLEHRTTESPATLLQATRGFTPADYDMYLYVPVMKNNFGDRSTGLQVMNVSGGPIDVDVEYFETLGTCSGITGSSKDGLLDGESWTFLQDGFPSGCLASAKVTASGNVVGVVNESFFYGSHTQSSTTYAAFPAKLASQKLAAPVFKERFGPKGTGLSVQNVGEYTAEVTAEFTVDLSQSGTPAGSVYKATFDLPAGESMTLLDVNSLPGLVWEGGNELPVGNLCAVVVTANRPIVALANESPWPAGSPSLQDKNNYEAFNLLAD